ncbi:tetraspanin-1-like isoform X2 [Brachyhypopomus gauderio]|uniref:tetraspanin-1-like isoform X2 n=1 Tax=Brachyhypopomus gauderio TaxID=698409 RepID=UPI0040424C20
MYCFMTVRIILWVFSAVICLAGSVVVVMGALTLKDYTNLEEMLSHSQDPEPDLRPLASTGYVLMAMGAGLSLVGLLGYWGCHCGNKYIFLIFFIIVLIVFLSVVSGAVFVLVFQQVLKRLLDEVSHKVVHSIKSTYGERNIFTNILDKTMDLKCCGYNSYEDFTDTKFVKENSLYPNNCCFHGQPGMCTQEAAKSTKVHGCFNTPLKLVEEHSALLGGVAICIAAIKVGAAAACFTLYIRRITAVNQQV